MKQSENTNLNRKIAVIGEGWSALSLVGFLKACGVAEIIWVAGTGARIEATIPGMDRLGAALWKLLAERFSIEAGDLESGCFLREFRNKAFRPPAWVSAPTPESRQEVLDEVLWDGEKSFVPAFEGRLQTPFGEIEARLREKLLESGIRRIQGIPMNGIEEKKITLSSGEEIAVDHIYYADSWSVLPKLQGVPKPLSLLRKREPVGVLQATFIHGEAFGQELQYGFFGPIQKEAGEEFPRHVWGSFSQDGKSSTWSVLLTHAEVEDNHQIAKKLRRMKQAIEKMVAAAGWLGEGRAYFVQEGAPRTAGAQALVHEEQVRFEESLFFSNTSAQAAEVLTTPAIVSKLKGVSFLTDGYGPDRAILQAAAVLRDDFDTDFLSEATALVDEQVWMSQPLSAPAEKTSSSPVS